jgi:hypothetical protein
MYEQLAALIDSSPHVKFSGVQGRGVSDEWVRKAEERLGLALPPSYKWWLRTYGGGRIYGDEVFSVYEIDFEEAAGGDIVYTAITNEKNGLGGKGKLFICDPGTDEAWYFDTNRPDVDGEYPVYLYDYTDSTSSLYADSFAEFLEKKIRLG